MQDQGQSTVILLTPATELHYPHYKSVTGAGAKSVTSNLPILSVLWAVLFCLAADFLSVKIELGVKLQVENAFCDLSSFIFFLIRFFQHIFHNELK